MTEEFKIIVGFENYLVSNYGNVKNKKTNKILKHSIDRHGYKKVNLYENNNIFTKRIHRLIAEAFVENPLNKPCVDHIDNNTQNNNINNLRWATHQENSRNKSMQINNTTGIKGITREKNKWRARVKIDGISIHLGYFDNIEDAKQARINKVQQVFGEFAHSSELN